MATKRQPTVHIDSPGLMAATLPSSQWKMARHLQILDDALVRVATGECKRLIVQMPPRHGKSELVSRHFPAWYLGMFPKKDFILCSATDDLAMDFSEASRDLIDEYGNTLFGIQVKQGTRAKKLWKTTNGGTLRAAGVGASIMGRGADVLLIDDFFKDVKDALSETIRQDLYQWYLSTSSTRLSPGGAVVIVCTRWHPKDLTGQLLEDAALGGDQWEVISFTGICDEPNDVLGRNQGEALWPGRFPLEWMQAAEAKYKAKGFDWMWEALYQQRPPLVLDAEFAPAYFKESHYFDKWPDQKEIKWKIMALDPSVGKNDKADYSAFVFGALAHDGTIYVDADLDRRDSVSICKAGVDHIRWFQPDMVFVESVSFQEVLQAQFQRELQAASISIGVQGINSRDNKRTRIRTTLTPFLAQDRFRWRRNSGGVSLLLDQLKGFPSVKFDDGPDALEMMVQGLAWIVSEGGEPSQKTTSRSVDYEVPEMMTV